jgi:hypothetical protein
MIRMTHGNGGEGDQLLLVVNNNGLRTLYQVVELGQEADVLRLVGELPAPAMVVDLPLPALPALDEDAGKRPRSPRSRLILLNMRTVTGGDANGVTRVVRLPDKPVRMTDAASPDRSDLRDRRDRRR